MKGNRSPDLTAPKYLRSLNGLAEPGKVFNRLENEPLNFMLLPAILDNEVVEVPGLEVTEVLPFSYPFVRKLFLLAGKLLLF